MLTWAAWLGCVDLQRLCSRAGFRLKLMGTLLPAYRVAGRIVILLAAQNSWGAAVSGYLSGLSGHLRPTFSAWSTFHSFHIVNAHETQDYLMRHPQQYSSCDLEIHSGPSEWQYFRPTVRHVCGQLARDSLSSLLCRAWSYW